MNSPGDETVASWLLDTSVVVDLEDAQLRAALPQVTAVSTVTLAELSAGPLLAEDPAERAERQRHLQDVETLYDPLAVDAAAARADATVAAAVRRSDRQPRRRQFDLLIAAVAVANDLPLATRNAGDLVGLEDPLEIHAI